MRGTSSSRCAKVAAERRMREFEEVAVVDSRGVVADYACGAEQPRLGGSVDLVSGFRQR